MLEATSDWSMNIDNGLINGVVFIDLKKAFDTIDHQIMLQKLRNYGIDQMSLTWFESYLTNRTQKCRVNDQLSNSAPVTCGVPQGYYLGPILFLIYINYLPNCLNHAIPRMFADDTSISYSANTTGELQNVINSELKKLNSWLITNRLKVGYSRICACAGLLFMWGHTGSCHPLFVLGPVSFVAITRALFLSQVNLIAQGAKKFPKYFELF